MAKKLDADEILEMLQVENPVPVTAYHGDVQTQRRQLRSMGVMRGHIRHGFLKRRRHTPHQLMEMSWRGLPWQAIVEDMDFMAHYRHDSNPNAEEPSGVWPIFRPKEQELEDLIGYCKYPWGEREDLFGKNNWATGDMHPVPGQKHIVWTAGFLSTPSKDDLSRWLQIFDDLADEYNVEFGITGTSSYRAAFSGSFRYAGISLKERTANGKIILPSGRMIHVARRDEQVDQVAPVVRSMGFDPEELKKDIEQIRMFNIASVQRAALTWKSDGDAPRRRGKGFSVDSSSPRVVAINSSVRTQTPAGMKKKAKSTDMVLCSSCSLWAMCPQYREGEVCSVSGSDGRRLAKMFGTRDPSRVIDALAELNGKMAQRAMDAMEGELPTEDKALDPTVTTALNQVFANGVKLAKLVDPSLNGGVQVNVGVTGGARTSVQAASARVVSGEANQRELAATVVAELESEGYLRSQITEDLVRNKMHQYAARGKEIAPLDAEVVEDE